MSITGGCHCGAIRYQAEGEALTDALCRCRLSAPRRRADGRMDHVPTGRSEGDEGRDQGLRVLETPGRRLFCPECGTGLFYTRTRKSCRASSTFERHL